MISESVNSPYYEISLSDPKKSTLMSPYSLEVALMAMAMGSADNVLSLMEKIYKKIIPANTDQVRYYKKLNSQLEETGVFFQSTSIWANSDRFVVSDKFIKKIHKLVDFFSCKFDDSLQMKIDALVKKITHNHIENAPTIDVENLTLIIVNVLHFNGIWEIQFPEEATHLGKFKSIDNSEIDLLFMEMQFPKCNYFSNDTRRAISLRYENNFSMTIILNNKEYDWPKISEEEFWDIYSEAALTRKEVLVFLPKFSYEYEAEISSDLAALMGRDVLGPYTKLGSSPQVIGKIKQKCRIDVDEKGTRASAITCVETSDCDIEDDDDQSQPIIFRANKPFSYYITHDESNKIIFMGHFIGKS